ncbi:hypothetical protein [Robiginitalea aurantiaca]|uniref:DUF4381 domain-containing protein n=1 Tax=Robiginitalea aurantiaca TaxID=3056915 RepID=A0ABT7WEB8_9FLAO|nr:hypothetical protein [Robiginitalea aurantiaca]MDM9631243.1 hypothetical protein [Robiginitalea aurantiaca]
MRRDKIAVLVPEMEGKIRILLFWLVVMSAPAFSQQAPKIVSSADTASIRIGEQIRWTVAVEVDSAAQVIFPEGQTFSPLETVEAFMTDTTRKNDRLLLQKTYALTQFDSGGYILPTQRIEIDGKGFFTDSILVMVATVPVDTVNQKMYDIKPMMEVQASRWGWLKWVALGLLAVLLAGGAYYWFFLRKKPLSEEEAEALLPPYERAMKELKRLEQSRYLIQDEFKQYYTELTSIVRGYLEEEVHISALESTTGQLLEKIELLRDAGKLDLEDNTLRQFQNILETADLVKFAKSKPELRKAEEDRNKVEEIVQKTKEAIPEPTEEELLQQEEYRMAVAEQQRKRKIRFALGAAAGLLVVALVSAIGYFGFQTVKDYLIGNPSKNLLEGEWVSSSYGYPPVILETPEVLYRKEIELPPEAMGTIQDLDAFAYDDHRANLSIAAVSTVFTKTDEAPDYEGAVDQILAGFERNGARNIITKQEEFTTVSGIPGTKVFGRGNFKIPDSDEFLKGKYAILLFGGNGFMQQVVISWEEDDLYAEEIVDRILNTIEVKTVI